MVRIEIDDETYSLVRFAARLFGATESEVIARAVRALRDARKEQAPPDDPWTPIPLYAEYAGVRIDAEYVRATRRLRITSAPLAGETFTTPSAAASAVINALRRTPGSAQTNGWRFWRIATTHQRLETLRVR